jgi:hypothetical protein
LTFSPGFTILTTNPIATAAAMESTIQKIFDEVFTM